MTKERLDGLYLMLLGSVVFLLLGGVLEQGAATKLVDFRVVYYPADASSNTPTPTWNPMFCAHTGQRGLTAQRIPRSAR